MNGSGGAAGSAAIRPGARAAGFLVLWLVLAGADVADQDAEALHPGAEVRQPHQRLRVLGRVEVEARDRRVGKRLLRQLVVVEVVHGLAPLDVDPQGGACGAFSIGFIRDPCPRRSPGG